MVNYAITKYCSPPIELDRWVTFPRNQLTLRSHSCYVPNILHMAHCDSIVSDKIHSSYGTFVLEKLAQKYTERYQKDVEIIRKLFSEK